MIKVDELNTDKDYIEFIENLTSEVDIPLMQWRRIVLRILKIIIKILRNRIMSENL